ncbi:MAG TPA: hypothetical protein VEI02_13040, partial [Planctomycetota bacterium]|nr:hypothetical protein [Planctomycetota bacterium]
MGSRGRRAVLAAVLAAFAAVVVAQDAPPVRWEKDVADALARARAESRPVLFAFNKDEEAANDETALRLYRDPRFAAKSGEFVCVPCSVYDHVAAGPCPRFPGVTCAEHKACELEARRRYLGGATTVVAPQHVFVGPDGVELFRKEYFASLDELLALMDDAVIRVHPEKAESRRAATRPVGATPTPTPPPDAPPTSLDVLVRTLQ